MEEELIPKLKVKLGRIYENLVCPICFGLIEDATITPCGHNFCYSCLEECLNIKHKCPFCNHDVTLETSFKNHHLDNIIAIVKQEKKEALDAYLNGMMSASIHDDGNANSGDDGTLASEKEAFQTQEARNILQRHFVGTFNKFKEVLDKADSRHKGSLAEFKKRIESEIEEMRSGAASEAAVGSEIKDLEQKLQRNFEYEETKYKAYFQELLASFDKCLSRYSTFSAYMPISVSLHVPSREDMVFRDILVNPEMIVGNLKGKFQECLAGRGDEIVNFTDRNIFAIVRTMSGGNTEQIILNDAESQLSSYDVQEEDEIHLFGELQLKSDDAKKCFSVKYKPGDSVDYYFCVTCDLRWICKDCAEACHRKKGHELYEFKLNHSPRWGCCYCARKGHKCELR